MSTSDPRDVRIAELERLLGAALKRIEQLEAEVADLKRNSTNSNKPPSSDGPDVERPTKPPSGRRPGGQPGHKGHRRQLLPVEEVDHLVLLKPTHCRGCRQKLAGVDSAPLRHQVTELPEIVPLVTEYQLHSICCTACGETTSGVLPSDVGPSAFGPRLTALTALCTGKFRMTKRSVQELLEDVLGIRLGLGSISAMEQTASKALAAPVEQARAYVRTQAVTHPDETGWREARQKAWLWVVATSKVSVYRISRGRGMAVAKEMLGEKYKGVAVSDRWKAYDWLPLKRRQICWAHLKRDFQGFVERKGRGSRIGSRLLAQVDLLFSAWSALKDREVSWTQFRLRMAPVAISVGALLRSGEARAEKKTAGMCREMLKVEKALWTFARVRNVLPVNNRAEQAIRPLVLWRKGSFGTHSAGGSRFVERITTAVATLKLQGRNAWNFLIASCLAALQHRSAPSLLPF